MIRHFGRPLDLQDHFDTISHKRMSNYLNDINYLNDTNHQNDTADTDYSDSICSSACKSKVLNQ